jgi:hypothetical protein
MIQIILGIANVLLVAFVGWRTIVVSNRSVEVSGRSVEVSEQSSQLARLGLKLAEREAERRRLERVGELVIAVYHEAWLEGGRGTGVAEQPLWNLQVALRLALAGLEERLPKSYALSWTESNSPAGTGTITSTWDGARHEVMQALKTLDESA